MDVIKISGNFSFGEGATLIENFAEKDKFVDSNGKILDSNASEVTKYKAVAKYDMQLPILHRIFKIFLGVILAGLTCGLALISEKVRSLFNNVYSTLVITDNSNKYIYAVDKGNGGLEEVPYSSLTGERINKILSVFLLFATAKKHTDAPSAETPLPPAVTPLPPLVKEAPSTKPAIKAMLFTSMAGNPVHKGHMAMIAKAIEGLKLRNIIVEEVRVSLSFESYIRAKVANENDKIKQANLKNGTKTPVKVLLPRDVRVRFLEAAIKESGKMFAGVKVEYWDDQLNISCDPPVVQESDHPDSYEALRLEEFITSKHPRRIYFVGGTDLCNSMRNWKDSEGKTKIDHAVIITRKNERPKIEEADTPQYSRIIIEGSTEFQDYSSTAIQQQRKFHLLPESVRAEFTKLHEAAQVAGVK